MTAFQFRMEYDNPPPFMISPLWPIRGWNARVAYYHLGLSLTSPYAQSLEYVTARKAFRMPPGEIASSVHLSTEPIPDIVPAFVL